ncbi:MAG: BMP family ABC transporter substrate-binding protein [Clostridia bacterium]
MKTVQKLLAMVLALMMLVTMSGIAQAEFAPVSKDEIKVGMVYIGDVSDMGYTYMHHQATLAMQKSLGLRDDQILIKTNISEDAACEAALLELIEQGCNIIFAASWGFMPYVAEMAEEYPDVIFTHCSGNQSNDTNFNNYFGRIYQPRYLAGIAAGLRTKTNKLGYVGAYDNSEVNGGINAFTLGALSVNPNAEVYVKYTNSWYDPTLERQFAEALLDMGCDVIAQHVDTAMPQLAAQERGAWGCGYNADMTESAPNAHLCAPIWHWDVCVTAQVKQVIEGTWKPENSFLGISEGMVDISPLTANCAEGTAEAVEAARAKILSGEFDVFDGEIKDNTGAVRVPAGERLSDDDIKNGMNWLVQGAIVK